MDVNDKTKKLAEQAGFEVGEVYDIIYRNYENEFIVCSRLERFAELIRADEREANAKLCENASELMNSSFKGAADAIRQRGEQP